MVEPYLLHFVVRNLTFDLQLYTFACTCYTNNAVHLWMRWTNIVPQKHIIPVNRRGAQVGTFIDQCFVAYHDIEQNEPGDTWTHTFNLNTWPPCERRWFYFWGKVAGELSPSASAIFTYHRPFALGVRPDKLHGATTVDGLAGRSLTDEDWSQIRVRAGIYADTDHGVADIWFRTWTAPNKWTDLSRGLFSFDLRSIPAEHNIVGASLTLYGLNKYTAAGNTPALAIFTAALVNKNNITPSAYNTVGALPLTNEIQYPAFAVHGYNTFTFTPQGLAAIQPGAIIVLGARESHYDATGAQPNFSFFQFVGFSYYTVEDPVGGRQPLLVVYHAPKGV